MLRPILALALCLPAVPALAQGIDMGGRAEIGLVGGTAAPGQDPRTGPIADLDLRLRLSTETDFGLTIAIELDLDTDAAGTSAGPRPFAPPPR
jgi:hypothetical protein